MWFSTCELATFLMTGDTAVKTAKAVKTFSGKGMVMMQECERMLNDSTVSDGLLILGRRATGRDDVVAHLLVVPRCAAVDADTGLQSAVSGGVPAKCAGPAADQAATDSGNDDAE